MSTGDVRPPPVSIRASLAYLGPGIILASSIVGSGELIAATRVGAEAGFALLWLIIIGCAIKVAAQIEIGRTTITWGRTPLEAFDSVPGPRLAGRGWVYWGWVIMTALILVQQGGILAGVSQTLSGGLPLTNAGRTWNRIYDEAASARVAEASALRNGDMEKAALLRTKIEELDQQKKELASPIDGTLWAIVVALSTSCLLAFGRYRVIERLAIILVGGFTLVTLAALVMLQFDPTWSISKSELVGGLIPSVPKATADRSPLVAALATFGIIGVGAAELMFYPYWCLEKGYGRAVGPRDSTAEWAVRARGWMRVMQLDAWASMVVYTVVTVAFYLLGAATLGRLGLLPEGDEMVRSLGAMYAPVFGTWAANVFLIGAFCVLYSTLFAAADGNSRIVADGLVMAGFVPGDEESRKTWTRRVAVMWPIVALCLALAIRAPVAMVLASGVSQAIMLAALAVAVLVFRYRDVDTRLMPSRGWDILLWISSIGFLIVGGWTLWQKLSEIVS